MNRPAPKFAVGELCLVLDAIANEWVPDTVVSFEWEDEGASEWIEFGELIPEGWTYQLASDFLWQHENDMRKIYPLSDQSFDELMRDLSQPREVMV